MPRFSDSERGEGTGERPPSPLTNHRGVRVWFISGQFAAISQGSVCTPPPHRFKVKRPARLLALNLVKPIIWVKDLATVTFIAFAVTSLRLRLSAGDWSSAGDSTAGAAWSRCQGGRWGGHWLIMFQRSAAENAGQQSPHLGMARSPFEARGGARQV